MAAEAAAGPRPFGGLLWRGAAVGAGVAAIGLWAVASEALFRPSWGWWSVLVGGLAVAGPIGAVAWAVHRVLRGLHPGAAELAAAGTVAVLLGAVLNHAVGEPSRLVLLAGSAWGGGLGALAGLAGLARRRTPGRAAALTTGLALLVTIGAIATTGDRQGRGDAGASRDSRHEAGLRPGPHAVDAFRYATGDDRSRPEFAAGTGPDRRAAPWQPSRTPQAWRGAPGWLRQRWWGFGADAFPMNGRGWRPRAPGPHPLVLIVHGNHPMERASDAGYDYLGAHLASHGFVAVSIDQNFLNRSFFANGLQRIPDDLDLRAENILEHLARWRAWSQDPTDAFFGFADPDQVVLVGHSRGGTAVAHAAGIAGRAGRAVRGFVGLAPIAGHPPAEILPLDASALVVHGSQDADLRSFEGSAWLARLRRPLAADQIAASVWIEGANHGQFNRDWGRDDLFSPLRPLQVEETLLSAPLQERATALLVTAFAEEVLADRPADRPRLRALLTDRAALEAALPGLTLRTEYRGPGFRMLADFEQGAPSTASGRGLRGVRVAPVERRWRGSPGWDRAAHVTWQRGAGRPAPVYALRLAPEDAPAPGDVLAFSLADADYSRPVSPRGPIELSLELVDADGTAVRLPLSRFGALAPLRASRLLRPAWIDPRPEIVFQGFQAPLAVFSAASPDLDPTTLREIRLVFDGTPSGQIALDDVGFRTRPAP